MYNRLRRRGGEGEREREVGEKDALEEVRGKRKRLKFFFVM